MTRLALFTLFSLSMFSLSMFSAVMPASAGDDEDPVPVVVLELFTSQGCSSCPPADRLLTKLAAADPGVIPLAFHVDYWDYIGWRDPFASSRWSERQRVYASAFDSNRVYTPQLVVDGQLEVVGSDPREVARVIAQARTVAPTAAVTLDVERVGAAVEVRVAAEVVGNVAASARLEVVVAVLDSGHATAVERGENASRTLRDDFVVRRLESVAKLGTELGSRSAETISVALEPSWDPRTLRIVALVQDSLSRRIYGAREWVIPSSR